MQVRFTTLLFVLLTFICLPAQTSSYSKIIENAEAFLQAGQFELAEEEYEKAIEEDAGRMEAHLGLGRLFSLQKKWRDAKECYGDILELYPDMIEAHYQQGICDREDGRTRDPITRIFIWKNSKNHFLSVIKKDPLYKEVFNEYAKLNLYQKNYINAIQLAHKQISIKPEARQVQIDIFKYYDFFITYGDSSFNDNDEQILWLARQNRDYDKYFIGEKYRRIKKYEIADSILKSIIKRRVSFTKVPVYLSLVRLNYELSKNEKAEKYYWTALNKTKEYHELMFIYDDTKYIMYDSDLHTHFPTLKHIRQYYRTFWSKRNLFPGYSYNMRMAEHYRRLVYAESAYRYDGLRLRVNSPDRSMVLNYPEIFSKNDHFNDRGLVYIRYGEADEIANYLTGGIQSNESWLYHESGINPKLIFHFEVHRQASANDWRLTPAPTNPEMVESRLGWDIKLDNYYMARTALDRQSALSDLRVDAEATIKAAMDNDRPFTTRSLTSIPLSMQVVQFLDEVNEDYMEIYLGVKTENLVPINNDQSNAIFERGVAVQDSNWRTLFKESDEFVFHPDDTVDVVNDLHIDRFRTYGQGGKLYISGHIKNRDDNQLGGYRFEYKTRQISKTRLSISDIVPAFEVTPTSQPGKFTHQGFTILPNPTHRFDKTLLVYFYYEIYNLEMINNIADYEVQQTIRPLDTGKSLFTKFLDIFRSEGKMISITKERQTNKPRAMEYTAFDFNEMDTGEVEIQIIVTDKNSGQTTEIVTIFILF